MAWVSADGEMRRSLRFRGSKRSQITVNSVVLFLSSSWLALAKVGGFTVFGRFSSFFSGFVVAASGKQLRSGEAFVTQVLVSILLAL